MFKCDVCMLNCLLIKPKNIFLSVLFVFGSDFCHFCFKVFLKIFVQKNLLFGSFAIHFASGCTPIQVVKRFEEISISSQIQA